MIGVLVEVIYCGRTASTISLDKDHAMFWAIQTVQKMAHKDTCTDDCTIEVLIRQKDGEQ